MAYYTNYGALQREMTTYYQRTGRRLQFPEAVEAMYQRGELSDLPPAGEENRLVAGNMEPEEFSRLVDSFRFQVEPGAALREQVNEDDIIPLLRDVFIIRHPRFTRPYLHMHNYVEINYVAEGSCQLHFEQEVRTLRSGELCIIAPRSNHDIEVPDDSTVYSVMFRRSAFETSFFALLLHDDSHSRFFRSALRDDSAPDYLVLKAENPRWIQTILQNAMVECYKSDSFSDMCCVSYINILFACLLRSAGGALPAPGEKNSAFTSVLHYIRQNYRTLTLAELAERFHYSKPHLCTLMKQNTGMRFTELVRHIRLSHAVEYLQNTNRSIGEIADAVGYHSADHFSRVFRSAYGISPQEYRRKNSVSGPNGS